MYPKSVAQLCFCLFGERGNNSGTVVVQLCHLSAVLYQSLVVMQRFISSHVFFSASSHVCKPFIGCSVKYNNMNVSMSEYVLLCCVL